jgi:Flp pilus assembly CpaF family ATPase
VPGATQAGKTTLLGALAAAIPARERVVTCEEVFELRIDLPDVVAMQTRQPNLEGEGEIRLRRLIKEALRMRPNRLLVGEVRQEESLDLLIALNSGIPGMTSLHANSAREALVKLTTLPLLAGVIQRHEKRFLHVQQAARTVTWTCLSSVVHHAVPLPWISLEASCRSGACACPTPATSRGPSLASTGRLSQ